MPQLNGDQPPRYYYHSSHRSDPRPDKPHRERRISGKVKATFSVIMIAALLFTLPHLPFLFGTAHATQVTKPVETFDQMSRNINTIIANNSAITFGVSIIDTSDGKQTNFGQTTAMTAASVSKLLTAAYFLHQVESGQQNLSQTLDDGNTASTDINQMLTVSSDPAWSALNDELGNDQLQSYANSLGVYSYQVSDNTMSPPGTADLYAKLYEGKLLNATDTKLVLGYLKQANYRDLVVPAVPNYDTIYHKAGEFSDDVNDATIITNGHKTIILVIYTDGNGNYDWVQRAHLMQQITDHALRYYQLN